MIRCHKSILALLHVLEDFQTRIKDLTLLCTTVRYVNV